MSSTLSPQEKNCPRCGRGLACGAQQGQCWCMNQPPLERLPSYEDCLCPDCLEWWRSTGQKDEGE